MFDQTSTYEIYTRVQVGKLYKEGPATQSSMRDVRGHVFTMSQTKRHIFSLLIHVTDGRLAHNYEHIELRLVLLGA
jgi:hypothetical protein